MFHPTPKPGLLRKREKIFLACAVAGLTLTLIATAAMAGTSIPLPPNTAQTFVSDAAKYGFNPQPEPHPHPATNMNSRMFNPQPEPPAVLQGGFMSHPPDPGRALKQGFVTR